MTKAQLKREKWLENNNFNKEGYTWIVTGESYSIKEELKDAGARFNAYIGWHFNKEIEKYAERLVCLADNQLGQWTEWGEFFYRPDIKNYIKKFSPELEKEIPQYEYFGEEKEKFSDIKVKYIETKTFEGVYGYSNIHIFANDINYFVWFTKCEVELEKNEEVVISGTVKTHKDYNGLHQTVVTRLKYKKVEQ